MSRHVIETDQQVSNWTFAYDTLNSSYQNWDNIANIVANGSQNWDTAYNSIINDPYLSLTGGNISGSLTVAGQPSLSALGDNHALTKSLANQLHPYMIPTELNGGTLASGTEMGNNTIKFFGVLNNGQNGYWPLPPHVTKFVKWRQLMRLTTGTLLSTTPCVRMRIYHGDSPSNTEAMFVDELVTPVFLNSPSAGVQVWAAETTLQVTLTASKALQGFWAVNRGSLTQSTGAGIVIESTFDKANSGYMLFS